MAKGGRLKRKRERAEKIQLYLSRSVDSERLILDLWSACGSLERPQQMFRRLILEGARSLLSEGDMPESLLKEVEGLGSLARLRPGAPFPVGGVVPVFESAPERPRSAPPSPAPARPAPATVEPKPDTKPNPMALIGLMGGADLD